MWRINYIIGPSVSPSPSLSPSPSSSASYGNSNTIDVSLNGQRLPSRFYKKGSSYLYDINKKSGKCKYIAIVDNVINWIKRIFK